MGETSFDGWLTGILSVLFSSLRRSKILVRSIPTSLTTTRLCGPVVDGAVYFGESYEQQNNTSAVDVENRNLEKYTRFQSLHTFADSATLEPGDVLFIPSI